MKKVFIAGLVMFLVGSVATAVLSRSVKKEDFDQAKNYFNKKGTLNAEDAEDYNFDETFSFKDATDLSVDVIFGDMRIEESKDNQLHVVLKSKVRKGSSPQDIKKLIFQDGSKVKIDFKSLYNDENPSQTLMEINGNGITITEAFNLTIEIPQQYKKLTLTTVSADADMNGLALNSLDIHNVSGDYNLKQISVGVLKMDNVSGDVKLDHVKADDLKWNTVSGDAEFAELKSNNIKIDTISGDVEFKYAQPADIQVQMDSVNGDIEGDSYFKKYISESTLKLGQPKQKITINSVSGDIEFKKQ